MREGGAAMSERATVTECDAVERAAEAMWRAEVQDIRTAAKARSSETWLNQSDSLRGKWLKLARAALAAQPQPSELRAKVGALREAADECWPPEHAYTCQYFRDWLLKRAADLERVLGEAGDA